MRHGWIKVARRRRDVLAYLGHFLEWWIKAEGMVADIAFIAQQEQVLIGSLTTALTDGAIEAAPAFFEHRP